MMESFGCKYCIFCGHLVHQFRNLIEVCDSNECFEKLVIRETIKLQNWFKDRE